MKRLFFILLLISTGCTTKKPEFAISLYKDVAYSIWQDRDYQYYCSKKSDKKINILFPLISNPDVVENIYNRGNDVIAFAKGCSIDAISITRNDLIEIKTNYLSQYIKANPFIIATNVYDKFNKNFFAKKYLTFEINKKKILLLSVISDSSSPDMAFYISGYRIENPVYEINRVNANIKSDTEVVILHSDFRDKSEKETKEYFKKFLSLLTRKPDYIIADVSKNIYIDKTRIIGYTDKNTDIYFLREFNFFKKINVKKMDKNSKPYNFQELDDMIKKTDDYFNRKLTVAESDIPLSDGDISPLGNMFAYGLSKFLRSDIVIFDNRLLKKGIKKGDVRIKDIYSVIKNTDEKFIYLKIRKEKLKELIQDLNGMDVSIYSKNLDLSKLSIPADKSFKNSIYRILTTENFVKDNSELLNHINEFSILNVKMIDGILWYARNYKLVNIDIKSK
ncbi:MAG: hypothetical protein KA059_00780 [Elusimicrobiales bacterium]|jgi:hypothetical protein|nr:hypothetical protein [Elusimicrobiales bacterium]